VLTAQHVVDDARLLAVWVPGESRAYPARVVYEDEERDFAFLVIPGTFPHHIALAAPSEALRVRQTVHAIGYPLDARRTDPQSSRGIISGVLPSGELQLDMGLNPGNSGGPLIDESERVVGIVDARGDPTRGVQNIGVAVPVEVMRQAMVTQVRVDDSVGRARGELDGASASDVAELVTILARVRAAEIIREVMEVVDNHRQGEILPRLRALGERSDDADVIALTAAYLWTSRRSSSSATAARCGPPSSPWAPIARSRAISSFARSQPVAGRQSATRPSPRARRSSPTCCTTSPPCASTHRRRCRRRRCRHR
jgi:hypothetical protein